ncbi:MAG: methyl viologen-reducing hydrogenase [Proteobacteria bacterium]|nr:methyl viologen-reducing hydrogenase [Pseudomonadota bacterium]MBU1583259.1 methyl viologen-reducing hydrogenase [Pseudomonadota bacterium]MBU2629345.1 methyl viologen-reducing hydrogenase [Pseudomonadota bacterium]
MPIKIASESLHACSGCEISILDMGEKLLELLEFAAIVHLPLLMDSKHDSPKKNPRTIKLPKADVGLISGGIKTREHLEVARALRKSCDLIVALGTCATHGGIPALANSYGNDDLLGRCFNTKGTDKADSFPSDGVPGMMDTCSALDEHISVDIFLPGCPPHPDHIFKALESIEKKELFSLPDKSVCDNCPATRNGNGQVKALKRSLELPNWRVYEGKEDFICFLEQGFLCMGPVTKDGCGGNTDSARCIMAQVPCRGCYGPVKKEGNQRLAMLNALASNGIDISSLPETVSMLRFSGGHGLLRPIDRRKESK